VPPDHEPPAGAATTDSGTPASAFGFLENGDFRVRIGDAGFLIRAADLAERGVSLEERPQPIPGLKFKRVRLVASERKVVLNTELAVPNVANGAFDISVNSEGTPRLRGTISRRMAIPALGNPELSLSMSEAGALSATATVQGADLLPRSLRRMQATGSGTVTLANGQVTGSGSIEITYAGLGAATVNFRFGEDSAFSADGSIRVTPPFMNEMRGTLAVDENRNLKAEVTGELMSQSSPIPALRLKAGTFTLGYMNGQPSFSFAQFGAEYNGLGDVTIESATLNNQARVEGSGAFALKVPMLEEASGTVRLRDGRVSGTLTVTADKFPEGLPVTRGTITATLTENGAVGFAGSVGVNFGPAGTGQLEAYYSPEGVLAIGAQADLTVPGLQPVHVSLNYTEGQIEGEVAAPINSELIPGLSGNVTVQYREGLWSGETTLTYSADDGKLSGTITVTVAQTPEGALQLGGSGSVTAQIAPRLQGTLTATILPEGGVDVSGAIEVTEPLELFPEERVDRELFRYSQNIPLWAILVAVIRIRAGVRAGIGPGVFRNIRVEGSYTIGADEADPSFTISGELFIPAFVEGYVAFGAGLGLDVVLGSLTGGIEAVGTAGLYGAISVVPQLTYADGDWGIEGTATMAAGARLKLGLNAWAEVEALWVTVWENEWELAQHVMPVGPDLGLQAHMSYKFGQPAPPEIEMTSSEIDTESLIQSAMPEDGPAPSGAREALQNRAEWRGQLQEQRQAAVPPETAAQANQTETPPPAPPRPGNPPGPPAGGATATGPGANQDPGAAPTPGNEPARSEAADEAARPDTSVQGSVPENQVLNADTPRYPNPITLPMLDEPPAPMPRTRAQEQEDIDAASKMVDLASAVSNDSDTLDNFFPRIKARFGLAELGYDGDFETGFDVVGKINPEFKLKKLEALKGTGIDNDLAKGPITKITPYVSQLGGDEVGIKMVAMPLGPDHPMGSEPSGQETLMAQMPTDPNVYGPADSRYVKGHLLNHNIGGPGIPSNLFPITAHANSLHHAKVEKKIKNWVNKERYWVSYTVEIVADNQLKPIAKNLKYINSTIETTVSVLGTDLKPVSGLTEAFSISSTFEKDALAVVDPNQQIDQDALDQHTARDIDLSHSNVQIPPDTSAVSVLTLPSHIENAIAASRARDNSRDSVKEALMAYPNFGEVRAELILRVYASVHRRQDKTITAVDFDGSGNQRDPSSSEKANLTFIFNSWGSSLSKSLDKKL
jgi:hypothetical protein